MPIIVDRESIKHDIIIALRECLLHKTIDKVTMRDIAKAAGISHAKILYYFDNKQQLFLAYVDYITELYIQFYKDWYIKNKEFIETDTKSRNAIIKLIKDIVSFDREQKSYALIQLFVIAQFDKAIKKRIEHTYSSWKISIQEVLHAIYGEKLDLNSKQDLAKSIQIVLEGIFIFSLNHEVIDSDIERYINSLTILGNHK